jgi:putative transposase
MDIFEESKIQLVLDALQVALSHRVPAASGLLFIQTAEEAIVGMMQWLRAFWGTRETEFVQAQSFSTREVAQAATVEWIEVFCNRQRIHSTLNYLSPV